MKKILLSLVTIIASGSLIFATTHAVWTQSVSIEGNKIETGNTDIQITTKENIPSEEDWNSSKQSSSLILSGLIPGEQEKSGYSFSLRNNSTSDINFDLSGQISNLSFIGENGPDDSELWIRIFDVEDHTKGSEWTTLSDWINNENSFNIKLPKGIIKKFGMEAKLDSDAGNDWQNQKIGFDMQIIGTQAND